MIKEIVAIDINNALGLVNKVFSEYVAKDYSEQGKQHFADYLKVKSEEVTADVQTGHKKIWGYFENDKILGVIAVREISHIALFFVDSSRHGEGIGRKLFEHIVSFVKQNGKTKITVNSSPYAVPVYESLGFKKTGDRQDKNGIIYFPMENEIVGKCNITLRPLHDEDITLMEKWLKMPYVAKWYKHPEHWLREIRERHGEFSFLTHFIAEYNNIPIGFCQYYDTYFAKAHEVWNDDCQIGEKQGETYSIDYLIGEPEYLRRGLGKQMIAQLINKIRCLGAKKIAVEPEKENAASNAVLEASGFKRCGEIYIKEIL